MFSDYFVKQAQGLTQALAANIEKRGSVQGQKDLNLYREFYTFVREHIPADFSLATGKVRNRRHLLGKNCDLLIYRKWCQRFLDLTGGYILSDALYTFMSIEAELTTQSLAGHVYLTNALKSLYAMEHETPEHRALPVFSVIFAYRSGIPLMNHRAAIVDIAREKEIPRNHEPDMVCILGEGLIIKDWEKAGEYKVVETGADTLMWFYVLLLEYLDRDNRVGVNARDYVKTTREYKEY